MATLRDIKTRIKGIQNIQQITKAMKMVAAAKLRRAQENVINSRPYAQKISSMLTHLVTNEDRNGNEFLKPREVKKVLVVVVTSDRGLCGGFNANIIREANRYIKEELNTEKIESSIYCVGKKGYDFFRKRDFDVVGKITGIFSSLKYESSLEISKFLISGYLNGDYDKVVLIYNEFKSIIQQRIVIEQFLPVPLNSEKNDEEESNNYIYEPGQKYIFNHLLPKHLNAQIWKVLLESNAAEFGAQMTAMDNATTNAKELIRSLQLTYNKERQAAITKEILEIVSGANALQGG